VKGYRTKDSITAQRASSVGAMTKSTNSQTKHFDALNTQPVNSAGILGFQQAFQHAWADPSKLYTSSRNARLLLEEARNSVASGLNLKSEEIAFTPSFPFIFSHAISGIIRGGQFENKKIILSEVEQSAILSTANNYQNHKLKVNSDATINLGEFLDQLDQNDIGLAILQLANHEIGSLQPIAEIYKKCQSKNIALLVDATMTHDLSPLEGNFDALILNPVAWQGPTGITILAIRENLKFMTTLKRDKRETRKFPASPQVALAVSAAAAFDETNQNLEQINKNLFQAKNILMDEIAKIPKNQVLSKIENSLPNIISATFSDIDGESLVSEMDKLGFEISSGSSCIADEIAPSHVLKAIGAGEQSNIRLSLPLTVTEDIATACAIALKKVIEKIRKENAAVSY
jgi:cysteine desulfurase